ncbi:hypothetical protein Tco_0814655 [Tanacetum coccineum]
MENVNPPPTNNPPVLPIALRAKVVQELKEITRSPRMNRSTHPLFPLFLDLNDDPDDGEVLSELEEYGNAVIFDKKKLGSS